MSASTSTIPFLVFILTLQTLPEISTFSTDESSITFILAFLKERASVFDTSSSSKGITFDKNSTRVTSTPMLLKKYANSEPIAPEPTTTILFGILSSTSASR